MEDMIPPITTVAKGRWTSAPVPVAKAIGTNPREATKAVIKTGLNRMKISIVVMRRFSRVRMLSIWMEMVKRQG